MKRIYLSVDLDSPKSANAATVKLKTKKTSNITSALALVSRRLKTKIRSLVMIVFSLHFTAPENKHSKRKKIG